MTFLAPALLALGLAVAVPLALHLSRRHQAPRFVFPAVRYLRRVERAHASRLRLRQLLLLTLRVLALLLVTAAAARPFLPTGGQDHHPTSVVIVLDNSMASGGVVGDRRVLDHLKDAALETMARATPGDRVWLIRAAKPWQPAVTGELEAVASAIRQTEPAVAEAHLWSQLERAAAMLAAEPEDRPREIHLLSALRAASLAGSPSSDGVPVLVLDPPVRLSTNRGITSVEVGGGMAPRTGERAAIAARVEAFGPKAEDAPDSVDVRLIVEGTVQGVTRVPVGEVATLTLPASDGGHVSGRVEMDADALAADDRRHFVTQVRPPPRVSSTGTVPFLDEALSVLEDAGRVRRAATVTGDVVIAPGALGADAVHRGAGVIILPPSTPLELAATNRRLDAAGLPLRLGPPGHGEARLEGDDSGLDRVLSQVRLRQVYPLERRGDAPDTVLLRLQTGEPWAIAGAAETGRYLVLGTPLTEDGGTIPTSAAMLPLLDRAINAWVAEAPDRAEYRAGDVVTITAGDSIQRPGAAAEPVQPGSVYRLTEVGTYRISQGGAVIDALVVNPPRTASDVRAMDAAEVVERLAGWDARSVGARAWADTIFQRRLGSDLAVPLLASALLVLVLEAGLAASGRAAAHRELT